MLFTPAVPFMGGASFDAATTAWVAAVVGNGGTVSAGRQTIVNDLIVGLKADSVWTKFDRLPIFAAENQPSALTDLVSLTLMTAAAAPTFTVDRGYTGNGSSSYVNSNFNPFTSGVNWTGTSVSAAGWIVSADATGNAAILGGYDGVHFTQMLQVAGGWFGFPNDSNVQATTFGSGPGLIHVQSDSSNNAIFGNGGSKQTTAGGAATVVNANIYFDARNNSGTADLFGQHQIAGGYFGSNMTDTEVANVYSRLRTYMTAVGVP